MGKSFRKRAPPNFVAIDFETANDEPETACAVGLVRVEKGRIVSRQHYYIRPPYCNFFFSYLHGISWKDVKTKPSFAGSWPSLRKALSGVEFLLLIMHTLIKLFSVLVVKLRKLSRRIFHFSVRFNWHGGHGISIPRIFSTFAVIWDSN